MAKTLDPTIADTGTEVCLRNCLQYSARSQVSVLKSFWRCAIWNVSKCGINSGCFQANDFVPIGFDAARDRKDFEISR